MYEAWVYDQAHSGPSPYYIPGAGKGLLNEILQTMV